MPVTHEDLVVQLEDLGRGIDKLKAERSTLLATQRLHEQTILRMREALKEALDKWEFTEEGVIMLVDPDSKDGKRNKANFKRIAELREEFGPCLSV